MVKPLSDGSTTLRAPGPDDARAHCEAVLESLPEVSAWLEWAHVGYRVAESAAFIERAIAGRQSGEMYEFFIVDRDDRFLGGAGLNRVDTRFMKANLGYWVRTSAAGRGVAAAASGLLARYGFEQLGLRGHSRILPHAHQGHARETPSSGHRLRQSGRADSNCRPPAPKAGALPG